MRKSGGLLLTLVLLLSILLSACNSADGPGSIAEGPDNEGGSPASKPTISIITSHAAAQYAAQADAKNDPYVKRLEELSGYNLDIELLGHADAYTQAMTLRYASMELADLVRTNSVISTTHTGAVESGVFLELDDLLQEYGPNILANVPEHVWGSPQVSYNGKIYGIPVMNSKPNDRIFFYRKDWLDQLQMDVPETLEEYLAFAEAVKTNDMNGDGNPNNEYVYGAYEGVSWMDVLTPSFGVHPGTWSLHDGKLVPDMLQPKMKEAIQFYKDMYDNGYMPKDFLTISETDRNAMILRGEYGSWGGAVYQYSAVFSEIENQEGAEVIMATPPKGPDGHMGIRPMDAGVYFVWVIPADTEHPEEVIKFLNYLHSGDEELERFFALGIEGVNHTLENGEVHYDVTDPVNAELNAFQMHQLNLNFKEQGLSSDLVLANLPDGDKVIEGYQTSDLTPVEHDSMYMPQLPIFSERPELLPGFATGNMFTDMWAKVVVGEESLDAAFDAFVANWYSRGGEQAIEQATEWYNDFHGNE